MKKALLAISMFALAVYVNAQDSETENLKKILDSHPQQDTFRVNRLNELIDGRSLTTDEMEKFATEALKISQKTGYTKGEGDALINLGFAKIQMRNYAEATRLIQQADSIAKRTDNKELLAKVQINMGFIYQNNDNKKAQEYFLKAEEIAAGTKNIKLLFLSQARIAAFYQISLSNYPKAMEYNLKALHTADEADCLPCQAQIWGSLGTTYGVLGDQANALLYFQKAATANKRLGNKSLEGVLYTNIGERYRVMGNYPEAIKSYMQSLEVLKVIKDPLRIEINESNIADVYVRMDSLSLAFQYAFRSLDTAFKIKDAEGIAWIDGILARAYLKKYMPDSALYHAHRGLDSAKSAGTIEFMRDNAEALAKTYAFKKDFSNAYNYYLQFINYRDSMMNEEVSNKTSVLQYNYELEKKQAQITALNQQKKSQQNFLVSALVMLLLIIITVFMLLRSNRIKQKANTLLQKQKHEIEDQRDQTNKALAELRQTQKQLVQSEKMASLGELTAGIAHEIQNPLNFVNNFSEVSNELIEELKSEKSKVKSERDEQLEDGLLNDIAQNLEKINHHGKRADAIVKSMLQHSRRSNNVKEPTDINALCDEYARLCYHGLRAKDKSFNATINTNFDESIGRINIIPQDIGRVILNLLTNAFYAASLPPIDGTTKQEPTVWISTKKDGENVLISVRDNGPGIPRTVLDKIFQPFFTTKPTGEGTGLGLSLSYDIVTKGHGGDIKVNTKENEGTEFTIVLPA